MRFKIFIFFLSLFSVSVTQNERKIARDGNQAYSDSLYSAAETQYIKSLSANNSFDDVKFNLANTLFKQGRYDESIGLLYEIVDSTHDSIFQSEAYYNIGNSYMSMGEDHLTQAVSAYENCLKINPDDEEARYNLSKALSYLNQNEENNDQNQEEDNEKEDNQNSGQTDDLDDTEEEQEKGEQNENKSDQGSDASSDKKESEELKEGSVENQLSQEDMDRILDALEREEQKVQEKMRKINLLKNNNKKTDKDW